MGGLNIRTKATWILLLALALLLLGLTAGQRAHAATESGAVGIEGKVPGDAPQNAPSITFPNNGATINELPVTVTGVCQSGLTVRIFKNNVFGGAGQCVNGSYSIQIDLFSGRNVLVARQYNNLDQASPPSNRVTVTFPFSQFAVANRVSLSSSFAKRGADPGETLTWPITLSGGAGPYAITVDWGDGTQPDIISREFPGEFNIDHVYDSAGTYIILVRAVDSNGEVAFLQLVGVGNGEIDQSEGSTTRDIREIVRVIWWPVVVTIPMIVLAYWLGKKSALAKLRKQLGQK